MRAIAAAATALLLTVSAGFAAEAEGEIKSIDKEALTITLEDGKSYKLPPEIDMTAIAEGMTILLAYDKVGDQNLITDMQLSE